MPERARRLSEVVKQRRTQLGMNQGDLQHHGGPGVVAVGQIERGEPNTPQPRTFLKLDTALGWPQGTAWKIYNGDKVDRDVLFGPRVQSSDGQGPRAEPEIEPILPSADLYDVTIMAILNDPYLLPEAKNHLVNQYGLLRRIPRRATNGDDAAPASEGERDRALVGV